ncbi:MAG: HlyD family efflux transporter periplasmic adaptor subunit [Lachnotalea sp.]
MNESAGKRREWVKNAAIIFLAVMLALTFFSNTIMNYSLPEVATQVVSAGSITSKVRGTGTVSVSEPYNVTIKESRVIKSVAIKKGDVVEKGAVLFELEDSDSTELKEAEDALSQLILDYEKSILNGDTSLNDVSKIENGETKEMTTMQKNVESAKNSVKAAENEVEDRTSDVAAIQKEIDLLNNTSVDTSDEEDAIAKANSKLTKAQSALSKAEKAQTKAEKAVLEYGSTINEVIIERSTRETAYNDAQTAYDTAVKDYTDAKEKEDADVSNTELQQESAAAKTKMDAAQTSKTSAETAFNNIKDVLDAYDKATAAYEKAASKVTDCETAVTNAQAALTDKESSNEIKDQIADLTNQLIEANDQLTKANTTLTNAQSDEEDVLKNVLAEVDLGAQNVKIKEQQETVDKLKSAAIGAAIEAPVAGTIVSVSRAAGESTVADEALAVIQIADKGYSLSFSVTEQQAKTVKVGDSAEIQDAWNYDDCTITLASIKPDTESGGKKKLLTFDVSGNVQEGQELSISAGNKTEKYDLIVPSSAIREDNNGKFILTVESKSGPLGNRYIATRVDVEILATDDTQTAVSGGLYGYEYVITTATKPVEAGKQVRLTD